MALPFPANTICAVVHHGYSTTAPNSIAVPIFLMPDLAAAVQEGGYESDREYRWTHLAYADYGQDIRDDYASGILGLNTSLLYVPNVTGTVFRVLFVELVQPGTPWQHKRLYLLRDASV